MHSFYLILNLFIYFDILFIRVLIYSLPLGNEEPQNRAECVKEICQIILLWNMKNGVNYIFPNYLHLVRRFWNHVFTCASVIFKVLANVALSVDARYFCLWKRFSSSHICNLENDVLGFLRLGGVRFWYGWPILRGASCPLAPPEI